MNNASPSVALFAFIAGALVSQAGGCASSQSRQPDQGDPGARSARASPTGCYRIEVWPEGSDPEAEAKRARWNVPEIVLLTPDPLTEWRALVERYDSVFVARTWLEGRWADHPFGYWRPEAGGDSVYVAHPAAFAGMTLELARSDDGFEGRIIAFTDVRREGQPSRSTAPARAVPVACPGTEP